MLGLELINVSKMGQDFIQIGKVLSIRGLCLMDK